jgi:hypothetical protein
MKNPWENIDTTNSRRSFDSQLELLLETRLFRLIAHLYTHVRDRHF